jgi:hypothetical protein
VKWVFGKQGRREDVFMPRTNQLVVSSAQMVGADGAAVALLSNGARSRDLLCATDAAAARIDELQFTIGQGPCLEAFMGGDPVVVPNLEESVASARWPAFTAKVREELGVHALFAFPMTASGARLGVLELYRCDHHPLSDNDFQATRLLSAQLGEMVLCELERYRGLTDDVSHPQGPSHWARADINTAIGIIAVRLNIPVTDASAWLRAHAYAESCSIASLANDIVERRTFPG